MAKLQIFLPDGTRLFHDITDDTLTIGRLADNDLQIDDASVSSRHATITQTGDTCKLTDQGSTNGTFLNGAQITESPLRQGDEIRFGIVETVFHGEEDTTDQPLPTSTLVASEAAKMSTRPESFVSSSPIPKIIQTKDPVKMALVAAAVIGVLTFAAATVTILGMSAPV